MTTGKILTTAAVVAVLVFVVAAWLVDLLIMNPLTWLVHRLIINPLGRVRDRLVGLARQVLVGQKPAAKDED